MLAGFDEGAWASLMAIIGLIGRATWPLLSTRTGLLGMQLLIGAAFTAHYALIGLLTATIVNALGTVQTVTALLPLRQSDIKLAGYSLIAAMVAATVFSWSGIASLLVMIGLVVIAIARMRRNVIAISVLLMAGQSFLFAHDLLAIASLAVAADIVGFSVGTMMLRRRLAAEGGQVMTMLQSGLAGSLGRA